MAKSNTAAPEKSIKALQKRYADLNEEKIRAETQLEAAQNDLAELSAKAKKLFGTDDVTELQTKLAEMNKANDKMRVEYEKNLDAIETKLTEIKEKFADTELED